MQGFQVRLNDGRFFTICALGIVWHSTLLNVAHIHNQGEPMKDLKAKAGAESIVIAHLRNLVKKIRAGDTSLIPELMQVSASAPPDIRASVITILNRASKRKAA